MLMTVAELKARVDTGSLTDAVIAARLEAIEAVIRAYTNNNFQVRTARIVGQSFDDTVYGYSDFIQQGDTVQISQSEVNDGLYVVKTVEQYGITLDKPLFKYPENVVTKVKYPPDVVQCGVDMYRWQQDNGEKVGIKSETLSRHSVTYEDSNTLFMGYPVGILNGLQLHRKARC